MISPQEAYKAFAKVFPKEQIEAMCRYLDKGYVVAVDGDPQSYGEYMYFVDGNTKEILYYSPSSDFDIFIDSFENHAIDISTLKRA